MGQVFLQSREKSCQNNEARVEFQGRGVGEEALLNGAPSRHIRPWKLQKERNFS